MLKKLFLFSLLISCKSFTMDFMEDEEININEQNEKGETSLMKASEIVDLNLVKLLIKSKADTKIKDNNMRTALHYVFIESLHKNSLAVVKILVNNKVDINARDSDKKTAIFYFFESCFSKTIETIYDHNFDNEDKRETVINESCKKGLEITKFLLEAKADPNLHSDTGESCLLMAMRHYRGYQTRYKSRDYHIPTTDFIERLLKYDADLFACNRFWSTAYSLGEGSKKCETIMQKYLIVNSSSLPLIIANIVFEYTGVMPKYGTH